MNWNQRYKKMKKGMGYKTNDIAHITGNKIESIQKVTKPSNLFPRWLKLAIVVYETLTKKEPPQ